MSDTRDSDDFLRAVAHAPERAPAPADPQRLAHFRIVARIGSGGMGVVYRAEDEELRRTVALKVLLAGVEGDAETRSRFLREARAAAAIKHPNVATIHEVGEDDGHAYLVMEHIEGVTLRQALAAGPLPVGEAVRVATQIAQGLRKAHERGVVHRDLKPENVMLDEERQVKVLDFGIAKVREAGGPQRAVSALAETVDRPTQAGQVLGTPGYMAPEQTRGVHVDARADLFSLGVVLYEMLAGTPPFHGETGFDVLLATNRDPPASLSTLRPEVPPGLEALVLRCLAKSPDERFASAQALLEALDALDALDPKPTLTPRGLARSPSSTTGSPRGAAWLAAGVVGLAATLALAGVLVWRARRPVAASSPAAPSPSALASGQGSAITDRAPPKTSNPEAAREFAQAMQAIRDASREAAHTHLERAVALDPSLAEGHLFLAWAGSPTMEERRKHLASAVELRSQLGERDAAILEILQARLARDAFDYEDEWRRWKALTARFPLDATAPANAGVWGELAGHTSEGEAMLDRALELDPQYADAYWMRATLAEDFSDFDGAVAAANRCLAIAPSASACLGVRAAVEQRRGQCRELEDDAHRMIALEPGGTAAYEWLAAALIARGASVESVSEALRHAGEHELDPVQREFLDIESTLTVDWLTGDFAAAIASFPRFDRFRASVASDSYVGSIVNGELVTLDEAGKTDLALAVADGYLKRFPALTPSMEALGVHRFIRTLRRRAGIVSAAELAAEQESCVKEERVMEPPAMASMVWFRCYGQPASAPEAQQALGVLETLAALSPLPAYDGVVYHERLMGQTLLLAGHVDEAIPHLRRAVTACFNPDYIPSHQYGAEALGEALETKGDVAAACAAFGEVLVHWGNARPRSVTADSARAHMKKLGCAR